jgi:hypothetical protein
MGAQYSVVSNLLPLPYHCRVRDLVQSSEAALWKWFESDAFGDEYADSVRLELLKSTYRMEPEAHPELYAAGAEALGALALEVPLAFYQAQQAGQMNAALCFLPGEAHIILEGPILATLSRAELTALAGHELAHYKLWTDQEGSHRTTMNLVEAMAQHPGAEPSHVNTARRLRRYTEIYADRGALSAARDPLAAIACLVKVQTGLAEVEPRAYLKQAEEVLRRGAGAGDHETHPEAFIRARALWLWHEQGDACDSDVARLIHEVKSLDDLDLLDQVEVTALTRGAIETLLEPAWICTERVLAHARQFFPDFARQSQSHSPQPATAHAQLSDALAEFIAYVLLDFAVVDSDLGERALGHSLQVAVELGCGPAFEKAARKELKLTQSELQVLQRKLEAHP